MGIKTVARRTRRARRARKPMKATRRAARKAKRVTKKMQTGSMRKVHGGTAMYTKGGLMKKDLCLNKRGKVVSKKSMAAGKRNFKRLQGWLKACQQARKQLRLTGFVACKKGTRYYNLVKKIYSK